jgi:DNA-binding HxlR family transcriptional regulator
VETRKSYGQFCGLARALDHVGERWTLLIVRELLIAPRSFRELTRALPGLSPNLLVQRLRTLMQDGLVLRSDAPARSKSVLFQLTDAGVGLEAAVFELIRWGSRWMVAGPEADHVEPEWSILALRALLEGTPVLSNAADPVEVDADGYWLTIRTRAGVRRVEAGRSGTPAATVTARMSALLAVAAGMTDLAAIDAEIMGNRSAADTALSP